jgi:hypothetical protein
MAKKIFGLWARLYWPGRRFFFISIFWGAADGRFSASCFFAGRAVGLRLRFFLPANGGSGALFFVLFLPPKSDVLGQAPGRHLLWCLAGAQSHSSALRDMPMHRFFWRLKKKVAERPFY